MVAAAAAASDGSSGNMTAASPSLALPTCEQHKLVLQQLRQHRDVDALEGAHHLAWGLVQVAEMLQTGAAQKRRGGRVAAVASSAAQVACLPICHALPASRCAHLGVGVLVSSCLPGHSIPPRWLVLRCRSGGRLVRPRSLSCSDLCMQLKHTLPDPNVHRAVCALLTPSACPSPR